MTICTCLLLWKRIFSIRIYSFSYKFLWRSAPGYSLGRGVFNLGLFFSYKFLRRSASAYLFGGGVFQLGSTPLPTNSYDDLHLPTLWEEEFSIEDLFFFLQIPMTICICLLFLRRGVFQWGSTPFPIKFLWWSASAYSLGEKFSIRDLSLFLQISMTICTCLFFGRGFFILDPFLSYKFLWRSAPAYSLRRGVFN